MALTKIDGSLVGLWISTDGGTTWKEVVCAEESHTLSGSSTTNTRRTKTCGPIRSTAFDGWTMSGAGVANTTPESDEVSADDLIVLMQGATEVDVKMAHSTDDGLYYREGTGSFSAYSEDAPEGDAVGFDYTIEISGNLTVVAPGP
jgi:hypothetical protein